MLHKTLFNKVIYKGVLGAIYGIVSGLLLGLLIWALQQVTLILHQTILSGVTGGKGASGYYYNGPPFEFFITLGMCFGALIGSVFGSLTALKEGKSERS